MEAEVTALSNQTFAVAEVVPAKTYLLVKVPSPDVLGRRK